MVLATGRSWGEERAVGRQAGAISPPITDTLHRCLAARDPWLCAPASRRVCPEQRHGARLSPHLGPPLLAGFSVRDGIRPQYGSGQKGMQCGNCPQIAGAIIPGQMGEVQGLCAARRGTAARPDGRRCGGRVNSGGLTGTRHPMERSRYAQPSGAEFSGLCCPCRRWAVAPGPAHPPRESAGRTNADRGGSYVWLASVGQGTNDQQGIAPRGCCGCSLVPAGVERWASGRAGGERDTPW